MRVARILSVSFIGTLFAASCSSSASGLPVSSAANPVSIPLEIVSVTSPVNAGAYASLVAKTSPGALCGIQVLYPSAVGVAGVIQARSSSGALIANGLHSNTADSSGKISWNWQVGEGAAPGRGEIIITATIDGTFTTQSIYFTVR